MYAIRFTTFCTSAPLHYLVLSGHWSKLIEITESHNLNAIWQDIEIARTPKKREGGVIGSL